MEKTLKGKVALVDGATRGAGRAIAVELARAGAFVYATGRSSRVAGPSDMHRPETIEETGDLMQAAGGEGASLRVDLKLLRWLDCYVFYTHLESTTGASSAPTPGGSSSSSNKIIENIYQFTLNASF